MGLPFPESGVPNVNFGVDDTRDVVFDDIDGVFGCDGVNVPVFFVGSLYLSNVYVSKFFDLYVG